MALVLMPTRQRPDERFVGLCKTLFGDLVDPDEIWAEVYAKSMPDQSELHVPGVPPTSRKKKAAATTALVGTGAGGILAAKELALKVREGSRRGLIVPGLALGADALATHELAGNARTVFSRRHRQPVGKALVPMRRLVDGHLASLRRMASPDPVDATGQLRGRVAQAKASPSSAQLAGQRAGQGIRTAAQRAKANPRRTAVAAGAVGAAGAAEATSRSRGQGYAKSFTAEGTFSKLDTDQRLAFGWASVVEVDGQPVVDHQGDWITADDLENAAYDYNLRSRIGGDMHRRTVDDRPHHVSDLIESVVVTPEKVAKMFPSVDPAKVPVGWWVGFKFHDEAAWQDVKIGKKLGFSIHGQGKRTPVDLDQAMGYGALT